MYFISQSNIFISQWTLISISSELFESERYFSKYFMFETKSYLSHLKSLFIFLFSSQTWIIILVPGTPFWGRALDCPEDDTDPWIFYVFWAKLLITVKFGIRALLDPYLYNSYDINLVNLDYLLIIDKVLSLLLRQSLFFYDSRF